MNDETAQDKRTYPVEHFWIHLEEGLHFDEVRAAPKLPEVLRRVPGPSLTLQRRSPSRAPVSHQPDQNSKTNNTNTQLNLAIAAAAAERETANEAEHTTHSKK
jgi:hypothetical protein